MTSFSIDMFTSKAPSWRDLFSPLAGKPVAYLEVGSYEGASVCWMLEHVLTHERATATVVDSWAVQPDWTEHDAAKWAEVYEQFRRNIAGNARVTVVRDDSFRGLCGLACDGATFDAAYVDGSHRALDCVSDMMLAWRMLKPGGLLVVDDVDGWRPPASWDPTDTPRTAVEAWGRIVRQEVKLRVGQVVYTKGMR